MKNSGDLMISVRRLCFILHRIVVSCLNNFLNMNGLPKKGSMIKKHKITIA